MSDVLTFLGLWALCAFFILLVIKAVEPKESEKTLHDLEKRIIRLEVIEHLRTNDNT